MSKRRPFDVVAGGAYQSAMRKEPWEERLLRTDKGALQCKSFNARLILENHAEWKGVIAYDEMMHAVVKLCDPPFANASRGEWEDSDDAELRHWLAENYGVEPKGADLVDAVTAAARSNRFHPVRDYLDAQQWDGTERLKTWLQVYCGAGINRDSGELITQDDKSAIREREYYALAGVKFLVGAVARVRQPGCKMDNVLILEGTQGLKKSTVLKVLFGEEWFSDSPIRLGDKDSMEGLRGLWLVELAELDAFNKSESTTAKAFFSSSVDRFRVPYGRRSARFLRQCLFAGTTNQHVYLRDLTGNRRYWPVACTDIDIDCLRSVRDQLWAEADHLYKSGEPWWPINDEAQLFEDQQSVREDVDVWESLISDWLQEQWNNHLPKETRSSIYVTAAEVMKSALKFDPHAMKRPEQTRVGQIMHMLGWRNSRRVSGGRRVSGYKPGLAWVQEHAVSDENPQVSTDDHPF